MRASRTWPGAAQCPPLMSIREALERYASDQEAQLEPGPLPDWVGMLVGPGGPYAERDEEDPREELGGGPGTVAGWRR